MKRRQIVKCLMLMAVALVATVASADILQPSYSYHALPRSAWESKIQEMYQREREEKIQKLSEKTGMTKLQSVLHQSGLEGFLILSLSPLVFGSIMGICLLRYIRFRRRKYVIAMALTFGSLLVSIFLLWLYFRPEHGMLVRKGDDFQSQNKDPKNYDSYRHIDITVDPKLGETYEQYLERVRDESVRASGPPAWKIEHLERMERFQNN